MIKKHKIIRNDQNIGTAELKIEVKWPSIAWILKAEEIKEAYTWCT